MFFAVATEFHDVGTGDPRTDDAHGIELQGSDWLKSYHVRGPIYCVARELAGQHVLSEHAPLVVLQTVAGRPYTAGDDA
jgi:hypothetical protein